MPFYLTNENIEATMERNPDDIFNPSDIKHTPASQNTIIGQLILQNILNVLEQQTKQTVVAKAYFNPQSSLEENCVACVLAFETDMSEYEIIYHIPFSLATLLEFYTQNSLELKPSVDKNTVHTNQAIFLNISQSIITSLNEEDLSFLQDIKVTDFSAQLVENSTTTPNNLYTLHLTINDKEHTLYLQLDNELNKLF